MNLLIPTRFNNRLLAAWMLLVTSMFFIRITHGQVQTDTSRAGLVADTTVPVTRQEDFGLLSLEIPGRECSAVLLRNDWVLTAAHCVELKHKSGNFIPDPDRPGQNVVFFAHDLKVKAEWGGTAASPGQEIAAVQLITLRPYDLALIKVATPFSLKGRTSGYSCPIWKDQFPYFGQLVPIPITIFGRGINQFANANMQSQSDGLYRVGYSTTTREGTEKNGNYLYWYASKRGEMIAGGDSGGPTFAQVPNGQQALMGIHSLTQALYVPGKPTEGWDWVSSTPEAADAPVKLVWDKLQQIMGPLAPSTSTSATVPAGTPPSTERHSAVLENEVPFANGEAVRDFNILYGVKPDGTLVWHRHIINLPPPPAPGAKPTRVTGGRSSQHSWNPTRNIGNGWAGGFKEILPGGQQTIYAINDNGDLMRYWHSGAFDGSYSWGEGPQKVGNGWSGLKVLPSDNGVVYYIGDDGILTWNQNPHYADKNGSPNLWANSMKVGRGWSGFARVFSGGQGVIYAVTTEGKLMWYRHKGYLNPSAMPEGNASVAQQLAWQNSWEGPFEVGTGWAEFTKIFSPGNGHIYGVLPNGDLKWYRHFGWQSGTASWDPNGARKIATGFDSYVFLFARITGSDPTELPK